MELEAISQFKGEFQPGEARSHHRHHGGLLDRGVSMRRGMGDGGQASVEPLGFELGVDGKGVVCARYRGPTHDAASGHYQALEGQPGP